MFLALLALLSLCVSLPAQNLQDHNSVRAIDLNSITYNVTTLVGAFESGFQDGLAFTSLADNVKGIAIDAFGKIIFADSGNSRE